jgi:DNA-binding LacI/PurR family transcriptional regulator
VAGEGAAASRRRPGKHGGARVTIADVARIAGVSEAAVSKAINNKAGVSAATRKRVWSVATRLGWKPDSVAVALTQGTTSTIGLVLNRQSDLLSADPFYTELLSGIEGVLAPRGYSLLLRISSFASDQDELDCYTSLATVQRVAGIILTEARAHDSRIALMQSLRMPTVVVGRTSTESGLAWEDGLDPGASMAEVTRHLRALGHRDIGYVSGPLDRAHIAHRMRALLECAQDAGMTLIGVRSVELTAAMAARATAELLQQPQRPTAVIYDNDVMAIAGIKAAAGLGLRVPDDVSVIGHDDLPISEWLDPGLTTIRQDIRGLGGRSAVRLMQMLDQPVDELPEIEEARLVVRESTAGPQDRPTRRSRR